MNLITLSAEEFISSTLNIGVKKSKSNRHRILYKKQIKIKLRGKTTIVTSLLFIYLFTFMMTHAIAHANKEELLSQPLFY